jgi:hypothetical protein
MANRPVQLPKVNYELIHLNGGLDQVTPTLSLPPGFARRAANFECSINGGYTRIAGYERYDGHASPSAANYNVLICALTATVAVGDTVTGVTSAATGKVIARSGSNVVLTRETGTFVNGETIQVSSSNVGTVTNVQGMDVDGLTDATYRGLAADEYRTSIAAVPGSGPIIGVSYFNGTVYAWRNNTGATAANLYKSTSSGWSQVALGYEIKFDGGTAEVFDGQTINGATSGAAAVVSRVVLESGAWSTSNAAGRFILSTVVGTFVDNEAITVSAVNKAVANGTSSAITLLPSGRVESMIGNFGGGTVNTKIYGCDGKNRGFEFDGTVYVPINTGMTTDVPTRVAVHKNHLFFAFGESLQFSGIGEPYKWTPLLGAGEIALNGAITNLLILPGNQTTGALGVYTRNDTNILYGTSSETFQLSTFNSGTGGLPFTAQNMDQAYVLDDRGVMNMNTSLNYGNFESNALTLRIRPFMQARRNLATASVLNREKGQYRIFFSDGTGIYMTFNGSKVLGIMPVQLSNPVTCCVEGETPDGASTSFFGSTNGFVYRLDAGTSFDGAVIPANINLVYNSIKAPRILKRYRKASVELTGDSYAEIAFGYDLGYRSVELEQAAGAVYTNDLRSSYWDEMTWDNFVWDGRDISPSEIEMMGTAENLAIQISSVSAIIKPFTVNNIIVHYTMRRGLR